MIKVFAVVYTTNQTMKAIFILVASTSTDVTGLIFGAATAFYFVGTNTIQSSLVVRKRERGNIFLRTSCLFYNAYMQ